MKKLNKLNYEEIKDFSKLLDCWLSDYVDTIKWAVSEKLEEIYNNEFAMNLLKELYERTEKERKEEIDDWYYAIKDVAEGETVDLHFNCHPLTHSKSYRDVLYDMYIKDLK